MTLCISLSCFVPQFASISAVHQVGIDSWGKGNLSPWISVTLQWYIHLYRAVQLISKSPDCYTWDLRRCRVPTGDKLEAGVVPVLWGLYMEINMGKIEPCPTQNSTGCSCPILWALKQRCIRTCVSPSHNLSEEGKESGILASHWGVLVFKELLCCRGCYFLNK